MEVNYGENGSKLWFSLDEDLHTGSPLNQWW